MQGSLAEAVSVVKWYHGQVTISNPTTGHKVIVHHFEIAQMKVVRLPKIHCYKAKSYKLGLRYTRLQNRNYFLYYEIYKIFCYQFMHGR